MNNSHHEKKFTTSNKFHDSCFHKNERQQNSIKNCDKINCKIITFISEKDTNDSASLKSLAFNFAADGKRVLLYDCDCKRSLTNSLFPSPSTSLSSQQIKEACKDTLYDQVIDDERSVKPCDAMLIANNIWLVPGNFKMDEVNKIIETEEYFSLDKKIFHLNQKTGKFYAAIIETARSYEIDYVFLNINNNNNVVNRCLLFSSHYMIIQREFCSFGMIRELKDLINKWYAEINIIRRDTLSQTGKTTTDFPIPTWNPKLLELDQNSEILPTELSFSEIFENENARDSFESSFSKILID
jgi:cellulose biosynthesis protein BcsQ